MRYNVHFLHLMDIHAMKALVKSFNPLGARVAQGQQNFVAA